MSASAVAARTSIALSVSKMDEELQEEPKCVEVTEELEQPGSKLSLDLDLDLDLDPVPILDQEDEDEMTTPQPAQQETSETESDRLQVDAQLRAMAVSATTRTTPTGLRTNAAARAHHDTAPSTATSTGTRSAGESHDDNFKDRLKPFIRTCQKFESGSGSGDQDGMVSMEDGTDVTAKKRKTRRGKPKHRKLKPYSKQQPSYQQRLRCRATGRPNKAGRNNNPLAPNNTNQFLMEDHNELPDLDEKIAAGAALSLNNAAGDLDFNKPYPPPARTRDSSFSIDSEEDFYYSSPEDEEEFLSKEFSSVYEETHAERLNALSKAQLIVEYIQLETKVDNLTKRLRAKNILQQQQSSSAAAAAAGPSESRDAADQAKKLKAFQQRIEELQQQNDQLRRENEMLRQRHGSPMSSVDSESDSDSSSSRSHGDSDCSDCQLKASPGSSPVPASYHASCREKSSRRKSSSVSSVASESESSTSNDSSCPGPEPASSPGKSTATTPSNNSPKHHSATTPQANGTPEITANGHATSFEIVGLPT